MNGMRRLTYRPEVLAAVRALHLSELFRICYYHYVKLGRTSARVRVNGVEALFKVRTPKDLRTVESSALILERDFLTFLSRALRSGDVFFDVGGHVGLFTVCAAKLVGTHGLVCSFEPESDSLRALAENIRTNGLSNVRIFRTALGETAMTGKLCHQGDGCPSLVRGPAVSELCTVAFCKIADNSDEAWIEEEVEIASGDSFREAHALPVPRAIKIDVEGYEFSVLQGLRKTLSDPACEYLCCEIHPAFLPAPITSDAVVDLVRALGFASVKLKQRQGEIHLLAAKTQGFVFHA